jgi:uncharacterized protein with HEPN domain
MPQREARVTLRQILDHAREASAMVQGRDRQALDGNRMLALALVRLLEIIGEAAGRVPSEERGKCPDISWAELVALRNRLIHAYDQVDLDIVWEIATRDLPDLIRALEQIPGPI